MLGALGSPGCRREVLQALGCSRLQQGGAAGPRPPQAAAHFLLMPRLRRSWSGFCSNLTHLCSEALLVSTKVRQPTAFPF